MKIIRKPPPTNLILILLAGFLTLASPSQGISQVSSWRWKDDVRIRTGWWPTRADASWQTSFSGASGHCTSRLKYHNLDADLLSLEVDILHHDPLFGLNLLFAVAPITNGRSQDTDYENNIRSSESRNPVDGRVELWSLEGRIILAGQSPLPSGQKQKKSHPFWQWQGIVGVQHYQDSLRMFSGKPIVTSQADTREESSQEPQTADQEKPSGLLNSHYDFSWNAIKLGVKSTWKLTKAPLPLCHSLEIGGKITPLLAYYLGTGIWNLNEDFAQNPSFHHKAYGYGLSAELSVVYHPWPLIGLELGWQYLRLAADRGTDTTYYYSGEKGKANLDEVRLLRQGWFVKSGISF
ncbi:MAG: hypothetical protein AB1611_21055 [bacterium]